MAGGGLLALVDDGQCIIFEQLADSLAPRTALNLSACCRTLRTVSKAVCADLLQKHGAVRRLCDRVNTSYTAVADAEELLWYGQGLDATHMTTLGSLCTNALPHLRCLNLSINRFGADGMQAMFQRLGPCSLPQLSSLDLTGNAFGSAGAIAFADALLRGALPKLEIIKLGRNEIGYRGTVALAPALQKLAALKELYLYSNSIGDEGVRALLENLGPERLADLRKLQLERNRISEASCATLVEALRVSSSCTCCPGYPPELRCGESPCVRRVVL